MLGPQVLWSWRSLQIAEIRDFWNTFVFGSRVLCYILVFRVVLGRKLMRSNDKWGKERKDEELQERQLLENERWQQPKTQGGDDERILCYKIK